MDTNLPYTEELLEIMSKKQLEKEVSKLISKMSNLINEKTALYIIAKKNGLVESENKSNPILSVLDCKNFVKESSVNDNKWISLRNLVVVSEPEVITGRTKVKNKPYKITTLEVTDGVEDNYGGIQFIKIRTFGNYFDKVNHYDRINLDNILMEHKQFENFDESLETMKTVDWCSLSFQKNSEIEVL